MYVHSHTISALQIYYHRDCIHYHLILYFLQATVLVCLISSTLKTDWLLLSGPHSHASMYSCSPSQVNFAPCGQDKYREES